jgi:hypothetical protein
MWEPQPLTNLRASKACRGENFTFFYLRGGGMVGFIGVKALAMTDKSNSVAAKLKKKKRQFERVTFL